MKAKISILLFTLFFSFIIHGESFNYSNYLPAVKKDAQEITIKISTLSRGKEFFIYYKTEGLIYYQIRKMEISKNGEIYYKLPVSNLYGNKIEYFIFEKGSKKGNPLSPVFTITNFTKKGSPEIYFMSANNGSTTPKKRNPFLKISPSLSTSRRLYDNSKYPGKSYSSSGNLKLYRSIYDKEYQFDFESNFSYLDEIGPDESHINLSSMIVRFKKGNHKFEAGDVSISNTDFTASYLNRRGLNYEMSGKKLSLNLFSVNSQQQTGFEGFGIPVPDSNLYGAGTGWKAGQNFSIKTLFISGKDTVNSKTLYSNESPYREGDVISIWSTLRLFKNSLTLKGEYAQSNFGQGEDSKSVEKSKDTAWKAGFNFYKGIVSANAKYKKIGSNYHSIANLMLLNDKEGLNSTLSFNLNKLTWNINYTDEKKYLNNEEYNMEKTKDMRTDLTWNLGSHFSLGAKVGKNNLDYDESTGLRNSGTEMETFSYGSSINYYSGSNSFSFEVGKTESKKFDSKIDVSMSLRLDGKFLMFNPSASYTETNNFDDNSISKMLNITLNSELKFIRDIFTLTIFSSYFSTDSKKSYSATFTTNIGLNLFMDKIFKGKISPEISLKGKYKKDNYNGLIVDATSVYLKAGISF